MVSHGPWTVPPSNTSFSPPGISNIAYSAGDVAFPNETFAAVPFHFSGTLSGLWVSVSGNSLSSSMTIKVRKNGADGNEVITVPAGTSGEFLVSSSLTDSFTAGDTIDYSVVSGAGGTSALITGIAIVVTASTNNTVKFVGSENTVSNSNSNGFANFYTPITGPYGLADQTESSEQYRFTTGCTLNNFGVYVSTNQRTSSNPTIIRVRSNGTNSSLVISVSSGVTGLKEDLTHNLTIVAGDTITYVVVMDGSGSGGQFGLSWIGSECTTTDGTMEWPSITGGHAFRPSDSNIMPIMGANGFDSGETNDYRVLSQQAGTLSRMHTYIQSNTSSVPITIQLRKNNINANENIVIAPGQSGYIEDTVNTDVIFATDTLDYRDTAPSGTGQAPFNYIGAKFTANSGVPLNVSGIWASDGGDKIPRDCFYPHCLTYSSSTISRTWDGTTAKPFSAQGQTASFEIVAFNNNSVDAGSITVSMSNMSCSGGTTINAVAVSSLNVTDTTTRPIQVFKAAYVQNVGMSVLPYGHNEYEERQYPLDLRVPCTVNVNNDCVPNSPTDLWVNRTMKNMYMPMAWIPNEEIGSSSYTVAKSSSQSFLVDVWVSTSIPPGTCTGAFDLFEGNTLSKVVPVNLLVYGFQLPAQPSFTEIAFIGNADTNGRLNGNRSPSQPFTGVYLTAQNNMAKLLKAHNITEIGDNPDVNTND